MTPPEPRNERAVLRAAIDRADAELIRLLAERRRLGEALGALKAGEQTPVRDVEREQDVIARAVKMGGEAGLDARFIETLFQAIIDDSCAASEPGWTPARATGC